MRSLLQWRGEARRFVATGLAVALGVAFLASALMLSASMSATMRERVAASVTTDSVVVSPDDEGADRPLTDAQIAAVRRLPGVTSVEATRLDPVDLGSAGGRQIALATTVPPQARASEGRMPRGPGEIALGPVAAGATDAGVGARLTVGAAEGDAEAASRSVTVVGLVDAAGSSVAPGMPVVYATNDALAAWTGRSGATGLTVGTGTSDPSAVRAAVAGVVGPGHTVRAGQDEIDYRVRQLAGGTDALTRVLLLFTVVALFVCVLVVGNTFAIVLAQRMRRLALLRCVGAGRGQVFGAVLVEALVVGVVASAVGVALAAAASAGLVAFTRSRPEWGELLSVWSVGPRELFVPVAVGVLLTVVASLVPARRATAVAPLAALRPQSPQVGARVGRVRVVVGVVLVVAGGALLAHGATTAELLTGVPGGMLSFAGVLVLGPVLVPGLLRPVRGVAGRIAGVPGRLAVDNARRNPGRAAATSSALLVGITLIAMMTVGAATAQASVEKSLAHQYPIDAAVTGADGKAVASLRDELAHVPGVVAAVDAPSAVRLPVAGAGETEIRGLAPAARPVLRDAAPLAPLRDGVALVSARFAGTARLADGGRTTIGGRPFTVVVGDGLGPVTLTAADLDAVAHASGRAAAASGVWLRVADDADPESVLAGVRRVAATVPGAQVEGAVAARAEMQQAIDTVLLVVVALLAVAVVIALVGVGNTLGLSVLERTQESALLRALGLSRARLRLTLAIEAALLALVGVVLGTALGVLYGWAGVRSLLGADIRDVGLVVPVRWLLLAGAVAVVAALLASVLPARRAAMVAPAQALATE